MSKRKRTRRQFGSFENLEAKQLLHGHTFDSPVITDEICVAAPRSEVSDATGNSATTTENASAFGRFESLEAYREFWIERAVEQHKHLFGTTFPWYGGYLRQKSHVIELDRVDVDMNASIASTEMMVAAYDQTNTQVANIDEADIVETDGQFVYIVSDKTLTVVDARDTDSLNIVSQIELQDRPSSMYLHNGRLSILSEGHSGYWIGGDVFLGSWDTSYYPQNNSASVTVFDVNDPSNPQLINRTEFEGRISESRAIDGRLYLVIEDSVDLPSPELIETPIYGPRPYDPIGSGPIHHYGFHRYVYSGRYESEGAYRAKLEALPDSVFLPGFTSYDSNGDVALEGSINSASEIHTPITADGDGILSIVSIDMHDDVPGIQHASTTVGVRADGIYMSESSIYVYHQRYDTPELSDGEFWIDLAPSSSNTHIMKFDISDGQPVLAATGKVAGMVDSQFSLDEHDGQLRIATTTGWWANSGNNLFILEQNGDSLDTIGSVENLAPGEQIYSVRYMGDRAYVVTFRQVDPLFTIDLSDPTNPEVTGELKIPGFSDYLHPVDENHLIGIGRNADEQTGLFQELQISLFNVSDLSAPILVDKFSFDGGRTGSSIANYEHHAVSYFSEFNTLAIPVSMGGFDWINGESLDYSNSVYVFDIDVTSGISLDGKIDHQDQVLRTLLIGDSILSMSSSELTSVDINDLTTINSSVEYAKSDDDWIGPITILPVQPLPVDRLPVQPLPIEEFEPVELLPGIIDFETVVENDPLDLNRDGVISALDADLIMAALDDPTSLSDEDQDRFDLNGDGFLTAIDALQIVNRAR